MNPERMDTYARRQFSGKREAVLNRSTLYPHSTLDYHSFPPSLTHSLLSSFSEAELGFADPRRVSGGRGPLRVPGDDAPAPEYCRQVPSRR